MSLHPVTLDTKTDISRFVAVWVSVMWEWVPWFRFGEDFAWWLVLEILPNDC